MNNMALALNKQGKYEEALGIFEEIFKTLERVLGTEHPDFLNTRNNMALVLNKQGKYDESLGIFEEVLNIQKRVLGAEHPDTLRTRNLLASTKRDSII
jgi:tetratricopeptide (TPR) repeat protein